MAGYGMRIERRGVMVHMLNVSRRYHEAVEMDNETRVRCAFASMEIIIICSLWAQGPVRSAGRHLRELNERQVVSFDSRELLVGKKSFSVVPESRCLRRGQSERRRRFTCVTCDF